MWLQKENTQVYSMRIMQLCNEIVFKIKKVKFQGISDQYHEMNKCNY